MAAATAELIRAAEAGDLSRAQAAVDAGAAVEGRGESGSSPMHYACEFGHITLVEWLHAQGAAINAATCIRS